MDFGAIGNKLKDAAGGVNLGPADVLKQFATNSGISLNATDLKALINDPAVKNALIQAIEKIAMSKLGGKIDQTAVTKNLGVVADGILQKAPEADTTKTEIVSQLQDTIKSKLGM